MRNVLSAIVICLTSVASVSSAGDPLRIESVTLSLVREAQVAARDAGALQELPATPGLKISKGEVLAVLDSRQEELQLVAAQLNQKIAAIQADDELPVKAATAQLNESRSGLSARQAQSRISKVEAQDESPIKIAMAENRLKQLELDRAQKARNSFEGSISAAQIDRIKTSLEQSALQVQKAKDDLKVKQMKMDVEAASVEQLQEEINRYQTELDQAVSNRRILTSQKELRDNEVQIAEWNLERRRIRAPFGGVVTKVDQQLGQWVEQGTPILRMIDLSRLRAEGFLLATDAMQITQGAKAIVRVRQGNKEVSCNAVITFISPEIDPVNQQVRIYAEFDNTTAQLQPGMKGQLEIQVAE